MRFFWGVGFFGEGCSCALMVNLKAATTITVLLLYYCTVPASDLVDCGGECRLEGKVLKMKGF